MSWFVQIRTVEPPSDRWITVAEIDDYELADTMAKLAWEGIEGRPAERGAGRIREQPTISEEAQMTPEELGEAERDLADRGEMMTTFAMELERAAGAQLGR